jgi:DNA-directed RNA polymerase subunit K/omega
MFGIVYLREKHWLENGRFSHKKRVGITMDVKPIFRNEVVDAIKQPRITREYFTKYEYTTLLATRAEQIAQGAKPLVSLDGLKTSDPMFVWNVAKREIEQRKLPFLIRRQMPNGQSEYWSAQELEVMW